MYITTFTFIVPGKCTSNVETSPVREAKCGPAGSGYLLIKSSNYLSSKLNHRLHLTLHARRML